MIGSKDSIIYGLTMPFHFPANLIKGQANDDGYGGGFYKISGTISIGIYFLMAYGITNPKTKSKIMKYAFFVWMLGIVIALFLVEDKPKPAIEYYTKEGKKIIKAPLNNKIIDSM